MGKKNENINLWLLEEERRKDRERTLAQTDKTAEVQVLDAADEPEDSEETPKEESKPLTLSGESKGFEQLDKEKEALEEESQRLDEETEKLNLRAKALFQKIIQETEKRNAKKKKKRCWGEIFFFKKKFVFIFCLFNILGCINIF